MGEVKFPENADEAARMVFIGMAWMNAHAPEKFIEVNLEIMEEACRHGCAKCQKSWRNMNYLDTNLIIDGEEHEQAKSKGEL